MTTEPKNIVVVTVDALRLDRVGYAGGGRGLTPNLDALAAQGVTFGNLITQAVETPVAHGSLLSGCFPRIRDLRSVVNRKHAPAGKTLLAEWLHGRGYQTGGFISAYALDRNRGFGAGFDHYGDKLGKRDPFYLLHRGHALIVMEALKRVPIPALKNMDLAKRRFAEETVQEAAGWLETLRPESPYFLFCHLFDTHCEYYSPAGFRTSELRSNKKTLREFETGKRAFDPAALAEIGSQYDMSVAHVDGVLGGLLDRIRCHDAGGRDTLVLIVADHGEGLGDHRYMLHGGELYDEEVRVPAIIASLAGSGPVGRIDKVTRSIDLIPTLLGLAGVEPLDCDGASAVPLLAPDAGDDRIAFTETRHTYLKTRWLRALRSSRYKYIYDANGRAELYDLASDPEEAMNIVEGNSTVVEALLRWQQQEVGV